MFVVNCDERALRSKAKQHYNTINFANFANSGINVKIKIDNQHDVAVLVKATVVANVKT